MKVLGAAAARDYSFDRLVEIGKAVNEQLVSIGSALDHCHVPGRQSHDEIGEDVCVVGAGIHNEPVSGNHPSVHHFTDIEGCRKSLANTIGGRSDFEATELDL